MYQQMKQIRDEKYVKKRLFQHFGAIVCTVLDSAINIFIEEKNYILQREKSLQFITT